MYKRFSDKLILRDHLAIDRTVLANERTVLSYARTGLAIVLTGAGAIRFFESKWLGVCGVGLIALGILVVIFGLFRYLRMNRLIRSARNENPMREEQDAEVPEERR